MRPAEFTEDPVDIFDAYVDGVDSGNIPACVHVRRAVDRHHADVVRIGEGPYWFDVDELRRVVGFARLCRHWKGEKAGTYFVLEPWQVFVLGSLFAWRRVCDGTRRFRFAYLELPRKNGKTFLAAVIGLYLLTMDEEPGAEIYCAATKRDQAKIAFEDAKQILRRSPDLAELAKTWKEIIVAPDGGKFVPLGRDADSLDGLNVHGCMVDEFHAHPDTALWDVLASARGARRQPLMWVITTAGFNIAGPCKQRRDLMEQILDPESDVEDDTYFAIIYTIDDGDDWRSPASWAKANPNLGVSVNFTTLEESCRMAENLVTEEVNFLTKHLNVWCGTSERWVPLAAWDACPALPTKPEDFADLHAVAGLDLSSTTDLTALALTATVAGAVRSWVHCWIPEERAAERERRDRVPYRQWQRDGWLTMTPGNAIDLDWLGEHVAQILAKARARVGIDPWQSQSIVQGLQQKGFEVIEVRQGYRTLSSPTKWLERLVLNGQINTAGNPCLRWQMGNIATETDPAGNIKLSKRRSRDRIDGPAALVTALAVLEVDQPAKPSPLSGPGGGLLILGDD